MKTKTIFWTLLIFSSVFFPSQVLAEGEAHTSDYDDYLTLLDKNGLTPADLDQVTNDGFSYARKAPIVADKGANAKGIVGSWSWRDGVICVTDSYTSFANHGHAGIIAAAPYYEATIEALNSHEGGQAVRREWKYRFKPRIYQCGVNSTTEGQDAAAARLANTWAAEKKPYSLLSTLTTTDTFYCSQLVYQAYRLGARYTLPHSLPGVITPSDLLHSGATSIIYRNE